MSKKETLPFPFLPVNGQKLQPFLGVLRTDVEQPVLAVAVDYTHLNTKTSSPGMLLASYGSIYLFKTRLIGAPEHEKTLHLLNLESMYLASNSLKLDFDDVSYEIKSRDAINIANALLTVFQECTFKVKERKHFLFSTAPDVRYDVPNIQGRPTDALKKRSLFFSFYYPLVGDQLQAISYFDRFEKDPGTLLVIGPHFHPGNYATAFGHAIAWETSAKTVVFQNFRATKFKDLFDMVLNHSQTIEKVALTDYRESRTPCFGLEPVPTTIVSKYWFMRDCGKVISEFMQRAEMIDSPMTELVLASCYMLPQEFGDAVTSLSRSRCAVGLQTIHLVRCVMKPFPFDDITRLVKIPHNLKSLTIRGIEVDATHILRAICKAGSSIRSVSLTHMQFRTDITDLQVPSELAHLNVSSSAFTETSLKSLLLFLTSSPSNPIIFVAQSLVIRSASYLCMKYLPFDDLQPNLFEVDWSFNHIPKDSMKYFFAFLYTQKHLNLLSINEVSTGDSTQFLSCLVQLTALLPLPGLDLSGKFPSAVYTQFISGLSSARSLRRLKLKSKLASDAGFQALSALLGQLDELDEVVVDAFRPRTPQPFIELWKIIKNHPSIQACEIPFEDLKSLGLAINRLSGKFAEIFSVISQKQKPSTFWQRLEYLMRTGKDALIGEEETEIPSFFKAARNTIAYSSAEDAQIDREAGINDGGKPDLIDNE